MDKIIKRNWKVIYRDMYEDEVYNLTIRNKTESEADDIAGKQTPSIRAIEDYIILPLN